MSRLAEMGAKTKELLEWKNISLCMIALAISLGMAHFLPMKQYEQAYVNERQCHCDAELVSLEEIKNDERTIRKN